MSKCNSSCNLQTLFGQDGELVAVLEMTCEQWQMFTGQWHKLTQHPGPRPPAPFNRDPAAHKEHRRATDEWIDNRFKHVEAVEKLAVGFGIPDYASEERVFVKWLETCGIKSLPFEPRQDLRKVGG